MDPRFLTLEPLTLEPLTLEPLALEPPGTGTSGTGTSGTGTSDTGTSDTGTSDTGTSDTGTSGTGTSGTGTSGTVPNLIGGTSYTFRVRAVNAQGHGTPSTEIEATPYDGESTPEPGAPKDLRAIPGDRQVTLNWKAPSHTGTSTITGYEYQYKTTGSAFDNTWTSVF